jgi:hypothetical protein
MVKISKQAKRAFSKKPDVKEAIKEIQNQFGDLSKYKLVVFFASSLYPHKELAAEFEKVFGSIPYVGCSTNGEMMTGKILHNSIVAIALDDTIINHCSIQIVKDLFSTADIDDAFNKLKKDFCSKCVDEHPEKYVGMIMANGLTNKEEDLIKRLNDLTEVSFVGGSAGDDLSWRETYVFFKGKSYTKSAVLVLLEPTVGFKVLKTQSFAPIGKVAKVTSVDRELRCIKTIDNIPAGLFYAQQLGVPPEKISEYFTDYSIGIMIYNEAYVHDVQSVDKDYNLYMYSSAPKDAEMQILKAADLAEDMSRFRNRVLMTLPSISAIIHFCCVNRFTKLQKEGIQDFSQALEGLPCIGFATYGEFFISFINQTSVLLVLY